MKQLAVRNHNGESVGTVDAPAALTEGAVHAAVLHQAVVAYLANQRQGNQSTKTRAEVSGSGRKLFRQKGLGRARMGDVRSPIRVGGGTIFGPKPRDYRQSLPKKMNRLAFVSAVRDKFQNDDVIILNELPSPDAKPRSKTIADLVKQLGLDGKKTLFLLPEPNVWAVRSARNIPKVNVSTADLTNTYEILYHDALVILPGALEALARRAGVGTAEEAS